MSTLKLFFGGSFDPIHLGHIRSAELLLAATQAQDITLLPNALSPLKAKQFSSPLHRKRLLAASLEAYPQLNLDWREVERGGASYTSDTLAELAEEFPNNHIAFVMGLDSFNHLDKWRDWQNLTKHTHIIVIARPGYQLDISSQLSAWLAPKRCENIETLHQQQAGHVYFCELQPMAISSSQIRLQLAQKTDLESLKNQLPKSAVNYIIQHKLYGA
ncbi:nicotinate-nucleotide adenylyltransferase [Agarivorans sp. DSG3-1]|uniref:nicotinate-nucleotide adenylyltransferase n=1 Tax=Agarivorans sp. DSG3-1 TaxID=3342249 RepID=UPI00398F5D3E